MMNTLAEFIPDGAISHRPLRYEVLPLQKKGGGNTIF